jgi:hypothetical protein
VRDRDHFVSRTDTAGSQRKVQGAGSISNADGVFHTAVGSEFLLESLDIRPQEQAHAGQAVLPGRLDFILKRFVLGA